MSLRHRRIQKKLICEFASTSMVLHPTNEEIISMLRTAHRKNLAVHGLIVAALGCLIMWVILELLH